MSPRLEKHLLQAAILVGGAYSILFAMLSVWQGAGVLIPGDAPADRDLESHFRYLSGIFLGLLFILYSCVPHIERRGPRFRLLGALIICGGLARLTGMLLAGVPGTGHLYGVAMELGVTPLLLVWQASLARRWEEPTRVGAPGL